MGFRSRGTIISEGMLLAGRDDLSTRAAIWLQDWLNSVAASWPWPDLIVPMSDTVIVTAGSLSTSLGNGAGAGYLTNKYILRIFDNIWLFTTDKKSRGRVRLAPQRSGAPLLSQDPTSFRGMPTVAKLYKASSPIGQWALLWEPIPDRDYQISFDYQILPTQMTSDADIPWYPNDATMIELVAAKCASYDDGEESPAARSRMAGVASMVANDRVKYGAYPGINDTIVLDPAIFGDAD